MKSFYKVDIPEMEGTTEALGVKTAEIRQFVAWEHKVADDK